MIVKHFDIPLYMTVLRGAVGKFEWICGYAVVLNPRSDEVPFTLFENIVWRGHTEKEYLKRAKELWEYMNPLPNNLNWITKKD